MKVARTVLNGRCPVVTRASTPTNGILKPIIYMGQLPHKQEKACGWNFHIKNGVCFQIFLEQLASESRIFKYCSIRQW